TDFFQNFPSQRLFHRLTRFDKSRQRAVHRGWVFCRTGQQTGIPPRDKADYAWGNSRVKPEFASGANPCAVAMCIAGGCPASTTILVIPIPTDDLQGSAGQLE